MTKPELSKENQAMLDHLIEVVEEKLGGATSAKEKKELSQLLAQLKDGSVNVAKATTILSLRGIEWTWSKTKPLLSGALNFVSSAWNEAKKRNTKTDDE
tara:strand:+ start:775 stop:1071 length:297 start_codon:yes stop_codon:yes gene_type:complete